VNLGTYLEIDGRPAVRFERTYSHSVERMWNALTEPDELEKWFPSRLTFDPYIGGEVRFAGDPNIGDMQGKVLVFELFHRFAFSWGEDEVHFELTRLGAERSQLTLTNILSDRTAAARNAAGWSVCLAELAKLIAGVKVDGPHSESADPWQPYYKAHIAAGLPVGADVPTSG
jgi:uncharacterized protein YndB with AHSA1/START domain